LGRRGSGVACLKSVGGLGLDLGLNSRKFETYFAVDVVYLFLTGMFTKQATEFELLRQSNLQ